VAVDVLVAGLGRYARHSDDIEFETAPGIGHWIIEEAPALVLDRIRKFLRES
jgi:pimeloyl-ACP methyl ester carboxylesterase